MSEAEIVTGRLGHPVPDYTEITSHVGLRRHPIEGYTHSHSGTDFAAPTGTPVLAADGGTVIYAGSENGRFNGGTGRAGIQVVIDHGNGITSHYLHLNGIDGDIQVGDTVEKGQQIGEVGNTGNSTGPHLHFTFKSNGRILDPVDYLIGRDPIGRDYANTITIEHGDRGVGVRQLQTQLVELGFLTPEDIDGDFRGKTEAAVKAFQNAQGLDDDGIVGPNTRQALQQELPSPERPQLELQKPQPNPQPAPEAEQQTSPQLEQQESASQPNPQSVSEARQQTTTAIETDGPFAATSRSEIISLRAQANGTSLGALTQEQAYDTARAVFGDSYGARALIALDRAYGPEGGDGTLVKRQLALGLHEGRLDFGRENPDPKSGYNFGTFQIGGAESTRQTSQERYNRLINRGIANYEELTGETIDRARLTPADKDIFSHIGHLEERSTFPVVNGFYSNETGIFRDLADPSLDGAELRRFMSRTVQGGILDIGESVDRWTDRENGLRVDLEAVEARANEPEATRREPSAPVLEPGLAAEYSPAAAEVQRILRAAGYGEHLGTSGPNQDGVDGELGRGTSAAIREFQRDNGLTVDGSVGKATWDALLGAARSREVTVPAREGQSAPSSETQSSEQALAAAQAVERILDNDERTVVAENGDRTLNGYSYDIQQQGDNLSVSTKTGAEILRIEDGEVIADFLKENDREILSSSAQTLTARQQESAGSLGTAPGERSLESRLEAATGRTIALAMDGAIRLPAKVITPEDGPIVIAPNASDRTISITTEEGESIATLTLGNEGRFEVSEISDREKAEGLTDHLEALFVEHDKQNERVSREPEPALAQ